MQRGLRSAANSLYIIANRSYKLDNCLRLFATIKITTIQYTIFIRAKGSVRNCWGEGHYLCVEGHDFFKQNFGRITIFLHNLRMVIIFLSQNLLILISVLVTILQLTGPSAWIQIEALFKVYLIQYISFLRLYVFQCICNCLENCIYLIVSGVQ